MKILYGLLLGLLDAHSSYITDGQGVGGGSIPLRYGQTHPLESLCDVGGDTLSAEVTATKPSLRGGIAGFRAFAEGGNVCGRQRSQARIRLVCVFCCALLG